jgi:hypothetical protein
VTAALALLLMWSLALRVWLATPDLTSRRFWDERYGVGNLRGLLARHEARPDNGFHPGLSYLPQAALLAASEALHRWSGRESFAVFAEDDGLAPAGYLLCRLLQALAGTLSLFLTFRIGRRLASPGVGLAAALLLALAPWHLRQSVIFKPDIWLVACSLLALLASLEAAENPTRRTALAAGAAVGLALATKFNAAPAGIPLAVALLGEGGWRRGARWGALALAAAAAVGVLLLLTPYLVLAPGLYLHDFGTTWHDYTTKGMKLGSSHLGVLAEGLAALLSASFHGPWIGAAGLVGLALGAAAPRLRRNDPSRARRLGPAMAAAYVAGYALLYAASTTNPSAHNWLPVAPHLALGAAWALLAGWARLTGGTRVARLLPAGPRQVIGAAAFGAICLPATLAAHSWVYLAAVPSTQEVERDLLRRRLEPLGWRVAVREEECDADWYADPAIVDEVRRLGERTPAELALADAELFPATRLAGGESGFYRRRIASGGVLARIDPLPFHAHGPAQAALLHPWTARGEPEPLAPAALGDAAIEGTGGSGDAGPATLTAPLAGDLRPGDVVSLEIWLPPQSQPKRLREVRVAGRPVMAVLTGLRAGSPRLLTERFTLSAAGGRVVLVLSGRAPAAGAVGINLQRWEKAPPGGHQETGGDVPSDSARSSDSKAPTSG